MTIKFNSSGYLRIIRKPKLTVWFFLRFEVIAPAVRNLEQQFSMSLILTTSRHEPESSNSVRESSDPSIPDDLLVQIFSRVPLKSIARFRCVSKSCVSILRRHDFTELFLTNSWTRPRLLFTIESNGKCLFYSAPQPHNPDHNSCLVATPYHPRLAFEPTFYKPFYICKLVCGLVIFQGSKRRQCPLICNPAKGKVLTLPRVLRKKEKNSPNKEIYLGYDPIGKQFKVLCLNMKPYIPNTHWVLTLESRKCLWRSVEPEFNFKNENGGLWNDNYDICIKGVLYFEGRLKGSFVIVCFHVRSEKFSFINKDEDMLHDLWYPLMLFNYKGKLGIYNEVGQKVVLWVLEDAENHKWSNHNVELSPLGYKNVWPGMFLGMTSSGELVYSGRNSSLCFYNIERNTVKRVHVQGLLGWDSPTNTYLDYVENMKFM